MGDATRTYFLEVFGEALDILEQHAVPYLVVGTIAESVHFGEPWTPSEDIDLLMGEADATRCLEIFPAHGYATHVRDRSWIFKVAKPNVTIDLIFRSEGRTEMGAEILERCQMKAFEGLTVRVPSVEDMSVHKILMDTDERPGHWHGAMKYLKHVRDWDYLVERARCIAPRKVLAALLDADDVGVGVPPGALRALGDHALPGETAR